MADVTVESSTTENNEAAESSEENSQSASAETKTTETTADSTETEAEEKVRVPIPYGRFAKVCDERTAAETRVSELETQLQAAQTVTTEQKPIERPLGEPPESLSDREKVSWYITQDATKIVEDGLGMPMAEAKILLASIPGVSAETYESKWNRLCEPLGLDPNDRIVQDLVGGLVKQGRAIEDALSVVSGFFGKKTDASSKSKTPQEMENDATSHTMSAEKVDVVFDKAEASKLAQQGKRVEMLSSVDILKAASKHRKSAG